ncbi:fatty acyl CoA syntetase 1, putative [Trypanosoma cruzi]|uniref:Fatty acyl CoA syntetase 1, putative n=2 Tax=Trypanosoma cruzi TaxID=5693 RepID=Q4DD92_TRYCC|nr:fatty acyl CoA syntetase 1, putative [Trypanosoma cruzi]EAN90500.1 fatty acyl CoA syntetase 1, putative [Trypanosoma cruzi]|eukprot:XP_812351.1 fatty acyl CoA syntetase 1 [Trypanosoma cruzi strain CL Brener]
MGVCLASLMVRRSRISEVPDRYIEERRRYGPVAVACAPPEDDVSSAVYRAAGITDEEHRRICKEWYEGENIVQRLEEICAERSDRRALAYRTVQKVETEKKTDSKGHTRDWEVTYLNDPTYMTYNELWSRLIAFGKGLRELGLAEGAAVAIAEDVRWEWLASVLAGWTQGLISVTVYANLGEAALLHALKEAECPALICNGNAVKKLVPLLHKAKLDNTMVIYLDALPAGVDAEGMMLLSWTDVLQKGLQSCFSYTIPSDCNRTALIMYTSGTVAEPKGVIHTFGSLKTGAAALGDRLTELLGPKEEGETYLAYLPLAHILEFITEIIMLNRGSLLCYGSPRTLSDMSARPRGDLAEFRPMMFVGVPRIFETIRKNVESQLPPVGSVKRSIFDAAYAARLRAIEDGKDTPFLNEKVFSVPRAMFGGKLRGIVCGGAPLGSKTQAFMNVVFGVPMAQGYGLTETCCNGSIQRTGELHPAAGQLLKGVEAKLCDTEEYKHTDTPYPRGALLLRGPALFKGYLKQEEATSEVFTKKGGWFHTGDVVEMDDSGCLRIIGRVKALAKNLLGEYIAIEFLEALYGQHELVSPNGVCVLVHPQRAYICALVLTEQPKAMNFASVHKIPGNWPEILQEPLFHQRAAEALTALAKAEGRRPFELLRHVRVLNDEWTPENGIMTASMKIRRSAVDKRYADYIEQLFEDE